jgi:hypothetical protein
MLQGHYCEMHNTKFYRNEKVKDGKLDVWYSHKKADGSGFCTEPVQQKLSGVDGANTAMVTMQSRKLTDYSPANWMYVCNAMNNAVNLASNGVIGVGEIGNYFNRILSELQKVA